MIEQKKRPTAVTVGRTAEKTAIYQYKLSIARLAGKCKCFICQMGCLLEALAAFMFFVAPFEPGEVSLSAGWALAAVAGWLCRELYHVGGNHYENNR